MDDIRSTLGNIDNREVTLGMIIEKLDNWEKVFAAHCSKTDASLEEAFKRLDQQDQYLFVFKVSKCVMTWFDKNGLVKWALIFVCFFIADWISRALYWDTFSKP